MSDALIRFEEVSKRFYLRRRRTLKESLPRIIARKRLGDSFYALRDISFEVAPGETLSIIGGNGSGKSTALKIIAGITPPTTGRVLTRGRISPLIELGSAFHSDLTGRENILLNASMFGISDRRARRLLDEIVAFAELEQFIDMPIKRFSSGMGVRLAFSVVVFSEPDILLVDEALAVGDRAFQEKGLERMREFQRNGTAIILVTHNLDHVRDYSDRTILLESGRFVTEGRPEDVISEYVRRLEEASSKQAPLLQLHGR